MIVRAFIIICRICSVIIQGRKIIKLTSISNFPEKIKVTGINTATVCRLIHRICKKNGEIENPEESHSSEYENAANLFL